VCVPLPDPSSLPVGVVLSPAQEGVLKTFLKAARDQLNALVDEHLQGISPIVCDVLSGHAWPEICSYADKMDIDLIIVATHGLTGLRHALLGSTAERIVQHAACPVLTVKAFAQPGNGQTTGASRSIPRQPGAARPAQLS
jgi:nucleotide-binding universal stress UspA family protein